METEQSIERTTTLDITPTWTAILPGMIEWIQTRRKSAEAIKWRDWNRDQLLRLARITDHLIARRDERDGKPKPDLSKPQPPNWQGLVRQLYLRDLESHGRSQAALERRRQAEDQMFAMAEIADELIEFEKARMAKSETVAV